MTVLRERLAADLAAMVERHGVVVWDDPEAAYDDVIHEVVPNDATVRVFDGSWFDLRFHLERSLVGQEPPRVVAYLPTKPLDPDPLEELRAIGTRFRMTLPKLLKNALGGRITEHRIAEIGQQCSTIGEAEAAIEGIQGGVDARLMSIVGDPSTAVITTAIIAGIHDAEFAERSLGDVVQSCLNEAVGGTYDGLGGEDLRKAAFRQVVLGSIEAAGSKIPESLVSLVAPTTAPQRKTCQEVVKRFQASADLESTYVDLAESADRILDIRAALTWSGGLKELDLTAAIDKLALSECYRLLYAGDFEEAAEIADARLSSSWWTRPAAPGGETLAVQFRAVSTLARLGVVTAESVPPLKSLSKVMDWYAGTGWIVDSAYRHSERIRVTSGVVLDELDDLFHQARQRYEAWLDEVLRASAEAVSVVDVPAGDLQRSVHTRFVGNGSDQTAYVLVDALRYELGVDLVDRLRILNAQVEIESVVGTPPSITPVGMAAVLPGADAAFAIDLDAEDRLEVAVGGNLINGVKDRIQRLENAHGTVIDLVLDDVAQCSNKELKSKIDDASLVLVRSTEIDSDGESDQLAASWGSFDVTLNVLQTAVAKLLHAGIPRVVITADHGFLAVRQLSGDRRIDKPATGTGELHRRAWIGRGGTVSESTVKTPLAAFGISGDLEIITPRGLGVFSSGGGLQFFHGGLSPQELTVPVITVVAAADSPEPKYRIDLAVAGGRIITGIVAVTVSMSGDLFTRESRVRLQLVQDGDRVGVVIGGDGFDPSTETIDANVDTPRVITLQVTGNLIAGSRATLEVIDAATGVRLEDLDVNVVANVSVGDDLD